MLKMARIFQKNMKFNFIQYDAIKEFHNNGIRFHKIVKIAKNWKNNFLLLLMLCA